MRVHFVADLEELIGSTKLDTLDFEVHEADFSERWGSRPEVLLVDAARTLGWDVTNRTERGGTPFFGRRGDRCVVVTLTRRSSRPALRPPEQHPFWTNPERHAPVDTKSTSIGDRVAEFGVAEPKPGKMLVIEQTLQWAPNAQSAAEAVRKASRETVWVTSTYQLILRGKAFWWNSGSFTEEFLLVARLPTDANTYYVQWSCVVDDDGGGGKEMMDVVGRLHDAHAEPMTFRVTSSLGTVEAVTVP